MVVQPTGFVFGEQTAKGKYPVDASFHCLEPLFGAAKVFSKTRVRSLVDDVPDWSPRYLLVPVFIDKTPGQHTNMLWHFLPLDAEVLRLLVSSRDESFVRGWTKGDTLCRLVEA